MNDTQIYLVLILIFLIAGVLVYYFIFNIYEIIYDISKKKIIAGEEVEISAIPVNSFGHKAPLRNSYASFIITGGKDLVEIVSENNNSGKLVLKSNCKTGKIIIKVNSRYSLFSSSLEIYIYANLNDLEDNS